MHLVENKVDSAVAFELENKKQRNAFNTLNNAIDLSNRSNNNVAPIVATALMGCFGSLAYASSVYSINELGYLSLIPLIASFACCKYIFPNVRPNVNKDTMYSSFVKSGCIDKNADKETVCEILESYKDEYEKLNNSFIEKKTSKSMKKSLKDNLINKYIAKLNKQSNQEMSM
ncbi:MAG: hypothetical protein ACI4TX_00335 [Christensenellales bacterium]